MKNLGALMKQAQEMQEKMNALQEKLADLRAEGAAGGGLVKVVVNGKGMLIDIKLDKSIIDPEDPEVLEDLIKAAFSDAKAKAEQDMQEEMQKITGGLNLPPGMNLPF